MIARLVLVGVLVAAPVAAQQAAGEPKDSWLVSVARWGKFATLGAAGGILALAAVSDGHADDDFDNLLARCREDLTLCVVGPDGRYLDTGSEQLYQATLDQDAATRDLLLVAQLALAASALLWIVDLTHGGGGPDDIPYVPLRVDFRGREARLGLTLQF